MYRVLVAGWPEAAVRRGSRMGRGDRRPAWRFLLAVVAAGGMTTACAAQSSASRAGPSGSSAAGSRAGVRVTPSAGSPGTRFRVSFTAPARTGRSGGVRSIDVVAVSGPAAARGCLAADQVSVAAARSGQQLTATLDPATRHSRWCAGRYAGRVEVTSRPVCRPGTMCPQFISVRPIGTFRFVVHAAA